MIVDTAVHYLEPSSPEHPWDPAGTEPGEVLSVEDAVAAAHAAGIDRIVQMAPSTLGWDNSYNIEAARRRPDGVLGTFGRFDPAAPDAEGRLRALVAAPEVLGVRVLYRNAPGAATWLADRAIDPFFAAAERLNVAVASYRADPVALLETARRFRGVRFIAEHMTVGKPQPGVDPFAAWPGVIALAREPNVWVQCSFFPEAAAPSEPYPFPNANRRFRELYEAAGARQLIWGAHYPRIKETCTYVQALNFIRESGFLTSADRDAILGDNFVRSFASARA